MGDKADCPNCGAEVRGKWVYPNGEDNYEGMYTVARDPYHFGYACPGSFESGAAVAFGLMGMAEAIRARAPHRGSAP